MAVFHKHATNVPIQNLYFKDLKHNFMNLSIWRPYESIYT